MLWAPQFKNCLFLNCMKILSVLKLHENTCASYIHVLYMYTALPLQKEPSNILEKLSYHLEMVKSDDIVTLKSGPFSNYPLCASRWKRFTLFGHYLQSLILSLGSFTIMAGQYRWQQKCWYVMQTFVEVYCDDVPSSLEL